MNKTLQKFVRIFTYSPTTNQITIQLIFLLQFIQNLGLSFPQHGWNYLLYKDKMLNSIQQISNFTLLLRENDQNYKQEFSIIVIAFIFYIFLFICCLMPEKPNLTSLLSFIFNINLRIFRLPLLMHFLYEIKKYDISLSNMCFTIIVFIMYILILVNTIYFQRTVSFNFVKQEISLGFQFSYLLYISFLLDLCKVIIFVFVLSQSGYYIYHIINCCQSLLALYINSYQQFDNNNYNASLIFCYFISSLFLIIAKVILLDEIQIVYFLLLIIIPFIYLSQYIPYQKLIKSTNILDEIKKNNKQHFCQFIFKLQNQDQNQINQYIYSLIEQEIKEKKYQTEENIFIMFNYIFEQQKNYIYSLYIINKFENQQPFTSIFYKTYSQRCKQKVFQELLNNHSTAFDIQQINQVTLDESQYEKFHKIILQKQIDFLHYLLMGSRSLLHVEMEFTKISVAINNTVKWMKQKQINENQNNIVYLKILANFQFFVMQNYFHALKIKSKIKLLLSNGHKTLKTIQLIQNQAQILSLSIIKSKGSILNSNKNMQYFFGLFSQDYKLEYLEQLLPETIQQYHNLFIEQYLTRNKDIDTKYRTQLQVLQQQENGFIQCLEINFTISQDISDLILIGAIQKINQDKYYIIFDQSGQIQGVSSKVTQIDKFYQYLKTYNYIQYYIQEIFEIIKNNEYDIEKEIFLQFKTFIHKIDKKFKQFNKQQQIRTQNFPTVIDQMHSERSDRINLLYQQINNSDTGINTFYITDSLFSEKIAELYNSYQSEQDQQIKFIGKLNRICYNNIVLQYQLELKSVEIQQQDDEYIQKFNNNDNDELQIEEIKAKSINDQSIISSDQKAQFLLQDTIQSQQSNQTFQRIIIYKIMIMLIILTFFIVKLVLTFQDYQTKNQYITFVQIPQQISYFCLEAFSYSYEKLIFQFLNQSQFLINQFQNNHNYLLNLIRINYQELFHNLAIMENAGYTTTYTITELNGNSTFNYMTPFLEKIREQLITLLSYPIGSVEFARSALHLRLNLLVSYNNTITLVQLFSSLLQHYSSNVIITWQYVLIFQILTPLIIIYLVIKNWFYFEKKHKYIVQILTRINEDQIYKLIDLKTQNIRQIEYQKHQTNYTFRSQHQFSLNGNSINSNLKSKENQYLYSKIKNKNINIWKKVLIIICFYIVIVLEVGFAYYQVGYFQSIQTPVETLLSTYVTFQAQLGYVISFAQIMKGQQLFIQSFENISSPDIDSNINNYFTNDQIPVYFSNISTTYSSKMIKMFQGIILSTHLNENDKQTLYNLYNGNICQYLIESLPFCNNYTENEFTSKYGQFYQYENTSEVLQIGMIGFISRLNSLFHNNFYTEQSTKNYSSDNSTSIYYQQDFNNLIIRYSLNLSMGFQLFYNTVNKIESDEIQKTKDQLLLYLFTFNLLYILIYCLVSIFQLIQANQRFKKCILSLVTLTDDILNDKTNLSLLKKIIM